MKFEERFVQTSCGPAQEQVRLGSGFLLSRDVVLTARHTLLPPEGAASDEIAVRGARGETWLDADLIWPASRADLAAAGQPDVALLRIRAMPPDADVLTRPLGLNTSEDDLEMTLRVQAVGFPGFKSPPDTHQIEATLPIFAGVRTRAFELNNTDHNAGVEGARTAADDWSGFSGSPVLAQRRVIGVIAAVRRDGRYDFRATRLDPLLADAGFAALLPKGAQLANAVATVETPPVDEFVYLLDRDDQELDFTMAHGACCPAMPDAASGRAQSLICVLPGIAEARHDPYEFLSRLEHKVLPELKWPKSPVKFQPLPWPRRAEATAQRLATLRAGMWRGLCGEGPAPDAPERYAELIRDPSRTRTFYSQIVELPLAPATAELLHAWATFLGALDTHDSCPPTHLLLVSADRAAVEQWLAQGQGAGAASINLLTELNLCTPVDLDEWMGRRLPIGLRRTLSPHRPTLEREFLNDFFVRDFRARVGELISARLNG